MRHPLLCLFVALCCLFVTPHAKSQIQKIYLHPKAAGSEKQSKFVDSIRFIPLEIKEGIELPRYSYVEITTNFLMIRDYQNRIIYVYAKDGRFVKQISWKKLGENFYPMYRENIDKIVFFGTNSNYTLTARDLIKIKLDWSNPRNRKYYKKYTIDLKDTSFAFKKDVPTQNDILNAYHFYDDYYSMATATTSELYKDSLDYEFKIYQGNKLVKSFFPYNRVNEPRFLYTQESVAITNTDTPYIHYLTRPFCDTIYKMVKYELQPAYQLVLPLENTLPASFYTKPYKNKTERENYRRNNGWMLRQIYAFYETPRFIYFMVGYFNNYEAYIYQKQTNTTFKIKNLKTDSSLYNMQLLDDYGSTHRDDKFYKIVRASEITAYFEKNKSAPVPKELQSFIKNNPPATAPIIVEFKLKN